MALPCMSQLQHVLDPSDMPKCKAREKRGYDVMYNECIKVYLYKKRQTLRSQTTMNLSLC